MTKSNKFIWVIVLFIALATIGSLYVQSFAVSDTAVKSGEYVSKPIIGYFECRESDNRLVTEFVNFGSRNINCNSLGDTLTQECVVTLKMPSDDQVKDDVWFAEVLYTVCTENTACDIAAGDVGTKSIVVVQGGAPTSATNNEYTITLNENQFVKVEYAEKESLFKAKRVITNKARFNIAANPFFIFKDDPTSLSSGRVPGTRDCVWGDANDISENLIIENVEGNGRIDAELDPLAKSNLNNIRQPDATVPYIADFFASPAPTTYGDGSIWCKDKTAYRIETITTPSGEYKVANINSNAKLYSVPCCDDGDVAVGEFCQKDLKDPRNNKVVKRSTSVGESCNAFNPCPIVGYQPTIGNKLMYQECVNSQCSEPKFIDVECSFDADCGTDSYCDLDKVTPEKTKCVTVAPKDSCGDRVCQPSFGENYQSCPQDCFQDQGETNNTLLIVIIIVVAVIIMTIIITSNRGKK